MNELILIGRLVADPILQTSATGKKFCRYTMAVDREKSDKTDFLDCTAFDMLAELLAKYKKKGEQIATKGRIETSIYEKDGEKRYTIQIIASNIKFL